MARPLRIEYPGAYYHITARGNERKDIYRSIQDREQFLSYLETATQRYKAVIHVYCLMSNHYHLLLQTPDGNLSQIMRYINGSYTSYFNIKRSRCGHLFQGRYKAIVVDADEYAGELSRYIHLNPVRAGIVEKPEEYKWSSYQYYIGMKKAPGWLKIDFILGYFGEKANTAMKRYHAFIHALEQKGYWSPLKDTVASTILGRTEFVEHIKQRYLRGRDADRNLPALTELTRASINEISDEVKRVFAGDSRLSKKAAIYLCHRYSGRTLKEIGAHYEIGESAVSQTSRRFNILIEKDRKLRKKVNQICKKLKLCNV